MTAYFLQLEKAGKKTQMPPKDDAPISPSEEFVRREIKKLDENIQEIQRLQEGARIAKNHESQ